MKSIILGMVATVVISVGAYFVLEEIGFSTADVTVGPDVRLGD